MRRMCMAFICFLTLVFCAPAFAMSVNELMQKSAEHKKGEITFANFLALCKTELASEDAKKDLSYQAQIYAELAFAYLNQGDLAQTKIYNEKALKINPKSARAVFTQGLILAHEGKHAEAAQYFRTTAEQMENKPQLKALFLKEAADWEREAAAISPLKLWQAFDGNEVAAEEQHKGKVVSIKGKISSITTDFAGNPIVSFDVGKNGLAKVNCVFPKEMRSTVAVLKKGQPILIQGTCTGMTLGQVFINNCE